MSTDNLSQLTNADLSELETEIAFTRIARMAAEMTPEEREQWLKDRITQHQGDFGTIYILKSMWTTI